MVKIAIIGAAGRMGNALIRCSSQIEDIELVAAIERNDSPEIGRDAGAIAGVDNIGVNITSEPQAVADSDVMIDFAFRTAVPGHVELGAGLGKAMVIGTTGLNDEESESVRRASHRIPIVWAPNMSLGINLLLSVVGKAASTLGPGYGVEIDETHHARKKDAPSGTALCFGQKIAKERDQDFGSVMVHNPEESAGEDSRKKIVIRSYREGQVVGDHTVSFGNEGERVEFTHHAWNRDAFALGALRAARWAMGREAGLYDMQDVLGL